MSEQFPISRTDRQGEPYTTPEVGRYHDVNDGTPSLLDEILAGYEASTSQNKVQASEHTENFLVDEAVFDRIITPTEGNEDDNFTEAPPPRSPSDQAPLRKVNPQPPKYSREQKKGPETTTQRSVSRKRLAAFTLAGLLVAPPAVSYAVNYAATYKMTDYNDTVGIGQHFNGFLEEYINKDEEE